MPLPVCSDSVVVSSRAEGVGRGGGREGKESGEEEEDGGGGGGGFGVGQVTGHAIFKHPLLIQ